MKKGLHCGASPFFYQMARLFKEKLVYLQKKIS